MTFTVHMQIRTFRTWKNLDIFYEDIYLDMMVQHILLYKIFYSKHCTVGEKPPTKNRARYRYKKKILNVVDPLNTQEGNSKTQQQEISLLIARISLQ